MANCAGWVSVFDAATVLGGGSSDYDPSVAFTKAMFNVHSNVIVLHLSSHLGR